MDHALAELPGHAPEAQRHRPNWGRFQSALLGSFTPASTLIQIDGSEHRWCEERADSCTLLVFIDDATGRLMQPRFVPSESAFSYFNTPRGYLVTHGLPVAFYSDRHTRCSAWASPVAPAQRDAA